MSPLHVYISWPSAPLTDRLVKNALDTISTQKTTVTSEEAQSARPLLEWATYDALHHEIAHFDRSNVLISSYIFRKALIRKHYLSRAVHTFLVKNPSSLLKDSFPKTFELELSFADELDEMWTDELYELGDLLDAGESWWILKPGMADRGMGIRLFHTKDELTEILESFEEDSDEEGEEEADGDQGGKTAVVTSQLRHFVIQEYIPTPLLLDHREASKSESGARLTGHKFHLRAYCVFKGDLEVYLYDRILALFSSEPYISPTSQDAESVNGRDLRPHLTNTSLQTELGEENVRLLNELIGASIVSGQSEREFSKEDVASIISGMRQTLKETVKAALANPIHFQPMPNAFELYGVDFLVSHEADGSLQVKLLEFNAEPAIELTGPRLTWILGALFQSMAKVCVEPFFAQKGNAVQEWEEGETKYNLLKCAAIQVR